jgi:hypothetical protein
VPAVTAGHLAELEAAKPTGRTGLVYGDLTRT